MSQKSQIEPWLAHRPTFLLVGVSEGEAVRRKAMRDACITSPAALQRRTCERLVWRKGLNAENLPSPPSQGKNILLTFPFIEPAQRNNTTLLSQVNFFTASCPRFSGLYRENHSEKITQFCALLS